MGVISESIARSIRESYLVTTHGCVWKGPAIDRRYLSLEDAEKSARWYVKTHGNPVSIIRLTWGSHGPTVARVMRDIDDRVWTDLSFEASTLL